MAFRLISFTFVLICSVEFVWLLQPCSPRHYKDDSFVCVCNSTYCDSFADYDITAPGVVTVFQSDKISNRFARKELKFNKEPAVNSTDENQMVVTIDRSKPLHSIIGFGGAFTDTTGINILKLDAKLGANVIKDYFGQHGLRYSMGRVPIGGTDFSTHPYTYDDTEHEDFKLEHFKLANEDFKYKIPIIKMAMNEANSTVQLIASPWSAPAWMKTNQKIYGKGTLKGTPNGTYYQTWADYFVKFLDEYKKNGVDFWGITLQNEPMDGLLENFPFNCMAMSETEQRDFIFDTLGPKLHHSGYDKNKLKVMIMDDQRHDIKKWADIILTHPEASKYVAGIAYHWYLNKFIPAQFLDEVHRSYSDYFLLSTEACEGSSMFDKEKVILGSWQRAENYAHDIISDLKHHTSGWIDWNMAVDLQGGPSWVSNFVDSPIVVNATSNEYYKQPMYYALGHFTRFLSTGSKRLATSQNNDMLEIVIFTTPAHSTIAVVLNKLPSKTPLQINDPKYGRLNVTVDGHSIQTFVWFD